MCPDNRRYFGVQKTTNSDFLAGRFAMNIDYDYARLVPHLRHFCFERVERIFQNRLHEGPGLNIEHSHFPFRRVEYNSPVSRRARWIIQRTQQPGLEIQKRENVFLVPDMIAAGYYRRASSQQVDGDFPSDPATASRVFPIHD